MRVFKFNKGRVVHVEQPAPLPQPETVTVPTNKPMKSPGEYKILRKQKIQLYDLLREWKNELLTTRPLYEEVAKRASTAIGVSISRGVVRGCLRDLEIQWHPANKSGGKNKSIYRRVYRLQEQVKALRDALMTVCSNIGEGVPVQIQSGTWEPKQTEEVEKNGEGN